MKIITRSAILSLFVSAFSYSQNTYTYSQPKLLEDGWETTSLTTLNVDTTRIYQLFNQLEDGENSIHSILLVKNKHIIIEEYFKDHSVYKQHDLRSVTKSIISLLLGIAIDKGIVGSVDDPVLKYLKSHVPTKNPDKRKDEITIKQLLTMSAGLDCNDWDKHSAGQEDKVYRKKDWIQYTLDLPMVYDPGKVSNYCSMGVVLIAEILSQASGMPIDKFAEEYLFNPLNISNVRWGHTSDKDVIPSGKRIYMTSRDMAKIGQLILNEGQWNDKRLISEKWISESTAIKTQITGVGYGYLWWDIPFREKEKITISKVASGNGGQYIMVFPDLEMVAIFTGAAYNSQEDKLPLAIMNDIFLPTFSGDN